MLPVFGRVMVEREEAGFILHQSLNRFRQLVRITDIKILQCGSSILLGFGPVDVVNQRFGAWAGRFSAVYPARWPSCAPASLVLNRRIDLAERSVTNAEFRRGHASLLEVSKQFEPRLRAFTIAARYGSSSLRPSSVAPMTTNTQRRHSSSCRLKWMPSTHR